MAMKASTRGMLLSGLVYPGLGQMLLGHKLTGIMLILGTSAGLIVLTYRLVQRTYRIMEQAIPRLADEALDLQTLKDLVERCSAGGWGVEVICLIGITGCWLLAIVHAYFIGRKIDRHPH
jgi:TM2 domain-containing membrane protein YozV